jgi:pSer/pThr/pTyr-binding forkhead associated (FHA) protein
MTPSSTRRFSPGTRLRYPIYDDRGVLLLKEGTALDGKLVRILAKRGLRLRLHATLEIVSGPLAGQELAIPDTCTVTVGRGEGCTIRPTSRMVSTYHCVITQLPLSLHLEDKDSTNGTFVNGERITDVTELRDGDRVRFGDVSIVVHLYACLEGETDDVQVVAQVILTDCQSQAPSVPSGNTICINGDDAAKLQSTLREVFERQQNQSQQP